MKIKKKIKKKMGSKNENIHVTRWRECEVNDLARHFHAFENSSQFTRLGELHLNKEDIEILFPKKEEILSFSLRFALDEKTKNNKDFTFRPWINVNQATKQVEKKFEFGLPPSPKLSSRVSLPFKEWLCKNWMELEVTFIDDVFAASIDDLTNISKPGLPKQRINQRLLSYHFTETNDNQSFLKFIQDHRVNIEQFILHLGVDMNKFFHKDLFSFSPVFEVHVKKVNDKQIREIRKSGLRCVPKDEEGDEIVYYEYSAPCPSTCPTED